jgi:hypothetical protein
LRHTFVPRIRYLGFTTRGKKGPLTTTGDLYACESRTNFFTNINRQQAGSPPRTAEGVRTSAGDVGVTTSPTIIEIDPIRSVPGGDEDLVEDQPQIDLALGVLETSSAQYLHLHLQAHGCRGGQLTGITPLGNRIGSKITRTCRPCGPASSPSITHLQ